MVLTTVQRYWAACDQANLRLILHRFQVIRPPYVIVRKASSFTYKLSFYQSTVLSSHALDGHQMYFGGSVVGKASTTDRDLAHPSHNFHRVKKCEIWRRLKHHSTLNCPRLQMQQDIRILKQKCNAVMITLAKFDKVGSAHP